MGIPLHSPIINKGSTILTNLWIRCNVSCKTRKRLLKNTKVLRSSQWWQLTSQSWPYTWGARINSK